MAEVLATQDFEDPEHRKRNAPAAHDLANGPACGS